MVSVYIFGHYKKWCIYVEKNDGRYKRDLSH